MTMHHLTFCSVLLAGLFGGCTYDDYSGQVPDNAYCAQVGEWPAEQSAWEARVFDLINYARALGANCTKDDHCPPTHPYKPHPALVCAARVHSMDMDNRGYFDHINPDGQDPTDRAVQAGYLRGGVAENISAGYGSPEEQFAEWMGSPEHCKAIMSADYAYIGIGTWLGSSNDGVYSTANFAAR
jgi:uncharacterized protein YkwD